MGCKKLTYFEESESGYKILTLNNSALKVRSSSELSNHLGNVLEVITDRKLPMELGTTGTVEYYLADVVSYSDYYPGGMLLPGRHGSSADYRYGFQNQEIDNEIKGEGNSVNYKYRMYDPRVVRFFAVDPLTADYPMLTPYQFSSNNTIWYVEIEGLEGTIYQYRVWKDGENVEHRAYIGKYTREDLDGDVNKIYGKPLNDPDGPVVTTTYAIRNEDGSDGSSYLFRTVNQDQPSSVQEVNELLGLTKAKEREEKEQQEQKKSEWDADRAKDAPLPARIGIKVFAPTAIVDAFNTLITGTEMTQENMEVTGAYDRVISPLITIFTGGYGFLFKGGPVIIDAIEAVNSSVGIVDHVDEAIKE